MTKYQDTNRLKFVSCSLSVPWNLFLVPCLFLGACFLFLVYLLYPSPIKAAGFDLSISPPLLQATIKPGKSISQVFTIYNNSSDPIVLTPRIVPFLPEDDQGNPSLQPQSNPAWLSYFSLINTNIKLGQPFTLPANKSDQLVLSIKTPNTAPTTDHYATLLISSTSEVADFSSSISGSIGSNILLTIANQTAPPTILNITNLKPVNTQYIKISQTYILDNLSPIHFTAKLENLGNHLTQAHGLFQIHKGTKVTHIQSLLPVNVLAQSTRELIASSSSQLKFNPKITQIGKYQASLNIRSENGSSQNSINLVLLPIKASIALILSLIILKSILTFKKSSSLPAQVLPPSKS